MRRFTMLALVRHMFLWRMGMALCLSWLIGGLMYSDQAHAQTEAAPFALFRSPEGIQFESFSTKWSEEKLEGLYEVLLKCGHGEELKQLKKIMLLPDKSTGKSGARVGHYDLETATIRIFEVESVPVERIMVHEYGHHFTYYWLHQKEGIYPNQLTENSEWAQKRHLNGYPVRWAGSQLPYSHKWEPDEIMAEDYVILFGIGLYPPPNDPKDAAYFVRQENDYIPMAETVPSIRKYWEEAAGLPAKTPLRIPKLQKWDPIVESQSEDAEDVPAEEEVTNSRTHKFLLRFNSAAISDNQEIRYGIHLIGFQEQAILPVKMTFGVTSTGKDDVEMVMDLEPMYEELHSFYTQIQIWALDPNGRQLIYTPIHDNWFEYNETDFALRPIPFPFQRQKLNVLLQKDGMPRWPLVQLFVNGRPITAVRRYDDQNGVIYIPIKTLDESKEETDGTSTSSSDVNTSVKIKFHQHELQLHANEDQALKDGQPLKLQQKIKTVDNEQLIPMSELNELLDVTVQWNEEQSALFVETT